MNVGFGRVRTQKLNYKREEMSKESWIKNVLKNYPEKSREETEQLYIKLFGK